MIMPRHQQYILQPVNPYFIAFTFALAFLLNLLPWGWLIGVPDFVALVVLFWGVHEPRRVGMGIAFCLGLLMDVHAAGVLGEHALAYVLIAYVAVTLHRRVLWLTSTMQQAFMVAPVFLGAQLVPVVIHWLTDRHFPGMDYFLSGCVEAVLWPLMTWLLLMPQRRPVDPDDTRPIN